MALVEARILLAAIANGRLAATIAEKLAVTKEKSDAILKSTSCQQSLRQTDGDSSDDEVDINELRQKMKQASQSVVDNRCLPKEFKRETRRKSAFASLSILQDAVDYLQIIVGTPTDNIRQKEESAKSVEIDESQAIQAGTNTSQISELTPSIPQPTKPASAKSATSRPRRAASYVLPMAKTEEMCSAFCAVATKPKHTFKTPNISADHSDVHGLQSNSGKLTPRAVLPPISKLCKNKEKQPKQFVADSLPMSAMQLDLGDAVSATRSPSEARFQHACTPAPTQRQSQSLGSARVCSKDSKLLPDIVLPLVNVAHKPPLAKSLTKMRTGLTGALEWEVPPRGPTFQWDNRHIVY